MRIIKDYTGLIIIGVIVIIVIAALSILVHNIKEAIAGSGISTFMSMARQADVTSQLTPKSVSGGDSIFLPLIKKDFPEFDVNFAKSEVENAIQAIFAFKMSEIPEDILAFADSIRRKLENSGVFGVKVHRTAISNYVKTQDLATVVFQTAFEYSSKDADGKTTKKQEKFETEYGLYFDTKSLSGGQNTVSLRCEYCGAPIEVTGVKVCTYCGSRISAIQDKIWKINKISIR